MTSLQHGYLLFLSLEIVKNKYYCPVDNKIKFIKENSEVLAHQQYLHVKLKVKVAQLCLTLRDPVD